MNTKTILRILRVVTWLVFVGLCIKTGAILFNYLISITSVEHARNLFGGLDLSKYYNFSFKNYSFIVSYKIALFATEAYIAFLLIKLFNTLNIDKPFNNSVYELVQRISYSIFTLWLLAILHNTHIRYIAKRHNFSMDLFSSDFVFLAAVIFIFAQIIRRGIELQTENDLTI